MATRPPPPNVCQTRDGTAYAMLNVRHYKNPWGKEPVSTYTLRRLRPKVRGKAARAAEKRQRHALIARPR